MKKLPIKQIIITTIISIAFNSIAPANIYAQIAPIWILIFYSYFLLNFEFEFEYFIAFFLGIIIDITTSSILGQNSIALIVASFFVIKSKKQVQIANSSTIAIFVFLASVIYLAILLLIHIITQGVDFNYWIFMTPLTTAIFYTIIATIMKKLNERQNRYL
jgi:rod shape-determining protein MreD